MWYELIRRAARRLAGEDAQTLVEYALILALVVLTLIAALTALTGALNGFFGALDTALSGA
jgi:Flp pilus assembly pilin Flp